MTDDAQLLRRYAQERSEEVFAELVRRHVGWVYRTSLRRTGGRSDLAQEVAQTVFTVLARKAESLCGRDVLAGWLYTTARYAAGQIMRAEGRRRVHETEAAEMSLHEQDGSGEEAHPEDALHLRTALVRELDRLPERDREALLLRFFEDKSFAEVGARLHVGEEAARKRVERGLERLGARLVQGGVKSSAGALAMLLASEATAAVPSGLQAAVTQAALGGVAPGASTAAVIQLMSATKSAWTGAALMGLAGVIGLGTASVAVYEVIQDRSQRAALTQAAARYQSDEQAYRAAERNAAAAQQTIATINAQAAAAKKKAEEAGPAQSAAGAGPGSVAANRSKANADAVAFLSANPQARAMLMEIAKNQIARGDGLFFFRQAGLTPAQIDAFETATAQRWMDTLVVRPNQAYPGENTLPDDQVAAIIGDQNMPAWQDAKRAMPAQGWLISMTTAAAEGGAPLSQDQVAALVQTVESNSPDYAAGQTLKPTNVNWDNVAAQAQQALSPAQWQAMQTSAQWQKVVVEAIAAAQAQSGGNGK